MFQKNLFSDQYGSVDVQEQGGDVVLSAKLSAGLGGGQAAGVVSASVQSNITLHGAQLIDLGFAYAIAKLPSIASELKAAQALVDAELPKA